MLDTTLYRAEVCVVVGGLAVVLLLKLAEWIGRREPGLALAAPLAVGFALRLAAIAIALAVPSIGTKLSTTDEAQFLATTNLLIAHPFSDPIWQTMTLHYTEVLPWAVTLKVFHAAGVVPIRLENATIQLGAVALTAWAAAILGGPRAGMITAWIGAVEPSNVFFSTLVHHEPLYMAGMALVLLGLVRLWVRGWSWTAAVAILAGLALVEGTRSYMAFFTVVGVLLALSCFALARRFGRRRALVITLILGAFTAAAGIAAAPHVAPRRLAALQAQLNFPYPNESLGLGPATVTTSSGLAATVVVRSIDLLVRPFPWQVASTAQKVAVMGTLLWYVLIAFLVMLSFRTGLSIRLAPVFLLAVCELIGFSLTLLNAGEGFRHRTNLILLVSVCIGVIGDRWLSIRRTPTAVLA
jgi:hypothetical protein